MDGVSDFIKNPKTQRKEDMHMYEFSDVIDKVNFDEEFSDVADNIKNDCKQLESIHFVDAVAKINEWIDKFFNPCNFSIIY